MRSRSKGHPATPARVAVVGLALCLFLPGPAAAQATDGVAARADSTAWGGLFDLQQYPIPGLKSPTTAFWWSALGTTAPALASLPFVWSASAPEAAAIILVGALVIGPSAGHFYADCPGRAWTGIGIRLAAGAVVAAGGAGASLAETADEDKYVALAVAGVIVAGASLVWDIARAPHSAEVHNEQLRRGRPTVGLVPVVGADGVGLRVAVTF